MTTQQADTLMDDLKREFRIVGEGLQGQIALLNDRLDSVTGMVAKNAEGITFIKLQIHRICDAQTSTDGKTARIELRMDGVETRLDGVESRLDGVENHLEKVKGRFGEMENRLEKIDGRLGRIEDKLDQGVAHHDARLTALEERLDT